MASRSRLAVVAGLVAVATLAACGSSRPAAATCPAFGSSSARSGPAAVTRTPAVALLRNVQVQASSCVDELSFLFAGGVPGWSVGYHEGSLVLDPSGQPARVAGAVHLVVRLQPASGVDLSGDRPTVTYDGPTTLEPQAPSAIDEVRRLGDFEAVTSWAIGLPGRRSFEVVAGHDRLVVRIRAPAPRDTRCSLPGTRVSVGYPAGWYAELGVRWACRFFDPHPFVIYPATDQVTWAVTLDRTGAPAADVVARIAGSGDTTRSATTRVAGLPATVLDVTSSGRALLPADYRYRVYVVATTPGALTITSAPAPAGPRADASRAAADRIARLLRVR